MEADNYKADNLFIYYRTSAKGKRWSGWEFVKIDEQGEGDWAGSENIYGFLGKLFFSNKEDGYIQFKIIYPKESNVLLRTLYIDFSSPPANDNCPGDLLISCNTCNSTAGTVAGATSAGLGANNCCTSCGGCSNCTCSGTPYCGASPVDLDVFYYFQAGTNQHTITVSNLNGFDAVVEVRSGCSIGCSNLIGCCDPTTSPSTVSITYNNFIPGQTYYIRVFDYGGVVTSPTFNICVTHSGSPNPCVGTGITENIISEFFHVYPNPTPGTFTIESKENNYDLMITNTIGEKILSQKIVSEKTEIDLSKQPNGIYFLHLKTGQGTASQKIIINK